MQFQLDIKVGSTSCGNRMIHGGILPGCVPQVRRTGAKFPKFRNFKFLMFLSLGSLALRAFPLEDDGTGVVEVRMPLRLWEAVALGDQVFRLVYLPYVFVPRKHVRIRNPRFCRWYTCDTQIYIGLPLRSRCRRGGRTQEWAESGKMLPRSLCFRWGRRHHTSAKIACQASHCGAAG